MADKQNQELIQGQLIENFSEMSMTLLESNPDCMKVLNREGRIMYLNSNGFCQLEFDPSYPVYGKYWWELWQSESRDQVKQAVSSALKGENVHFTEFCPTAKGTPKWWDVRVSPIVNDDGVIDLVLSVSRDITEQMKVARDLKRTEEKLITGIKVADVALAEIDYVNNVVTLTRDCAVLYGFSEDRVTVTIDELYGTFHPDYVDLLRKASLAARSGQDNGLLSVEHPIIHPDGSERWVRVNKQFIFEEVIGQGEPIRAVLSVQDITSRHEADEHILESERRFRSLAENSPAWIWLTDQAYDLEYANARLLDYIGFGNQKIDVSAVNWDDHCHPDEQGKVIQSLANIEGQAVSFEVRIKEASSGTYNWYLINAVPRIINGNFKGLICSGISIHNQKLSEFKKDEFIGIASHEMKTPLTVAKAYLQMLEMELEGEGSEVISYARKASKSLDRLHDLINELLDVSKIQNGKLEYRSTSFDFDSMIAEVVNDIQQSTATHTIIVDGEVSTKYTGDEQRLTQVMTNLIGNAIKYSPKAKEVEVNVEKSADEIKVSIRDNGIGIPNENLGRLFDKFYRVENQTVQFQGLGLGLYITQEIIARHGGRIWAVSELGMGSEFIFTLPMV